MAKKIIPTKGESLVIWRRRQKLTQPQAALCLEVSYDLYRRWEADKPTRDQVWMNNGSLQTHEVCYLLRRRQNKTQREIAAVIGLTRLWVIKMEGGEAPIERLQEYWGV